MTTSLSANLGFQVAGPFSILLGPQLSALCHAVEVAPPTLSRFAVAIAPSVGLAPELQLGFEL